MKKSIWAQLFFSALFLLQVKVFPQNYTWLRGSTTVSVAGVYGTQGVSSPANDPGARHGACTWKDAAGNLWLFGGEGVSANSEWFNDLWKYDPLTNQWTWVKGSNTINSPGVYGTQGVAAPANTPGAREFAMCWTDASGNFWLFGGDGFAATYLPPPMNKLADLWKYDPISNQWTWMKGPNTINTAGVYGSQNTASPANYPGGRYWGATWADNAGNFWLFGGRGLGASGNGRLNDLWKYNVTANQWTWVGGSQIPGATGVFGTLSVPAAGNYPGARECPGAWLSNSGKLILFGGQGYGAAPGIGYLNDMWEYNTSTGFWTWISGTTTTGQLGIYGTSGVPSALNMPGGRLAPACWTDAYGNYWMFGGEGFGAGTQSYFLNDLFRFNPVSNQWTWVKGSNLISQPAVYGSQGLAAAPNTPGARTFNTWWKNTSGDYLWLFGGLGLATTPNIFESTNDLWKFRIPCNPDSVKTTPSNVVCSGNPAGLTAYNQLLSPVSWYTTPSGGTAIGTGSFFVSLVLTATSGNSVYTFYAEANSCTTTPRPSVTFTVLPLPPVSISGATAVCPGATGTLTALGAQSYTWGNGTSSNTYTYSSTSAGLSFTVAGIGTNGCIKFAVQTVGLFTVPTVTATTARPTICRNEFASLTAGGASTYTWNNVTTGANISVTPSVTSTYTVIGTDQNSCNGTATVTQFVAVCAGLESTEPRPNKIVLSPNPSGGNFSVYLTDQAKLLLFNQQGCAMFEKKLVAGNNPIETNLQRGVYFYEISGIAPALNAHGILIIE